MHVRWLASTRVVYSGNHGAEWWEEGAVSIEPAAEPYLERVQEIAKAVERGITTPGTLLEDIKA